MALLEIPAYEERAVGSVFADTWRRNGPQMVWQGRAPRAAGEDLQGYLPIRTFADKSDQWNALTGAQRTAWTAMALTRPLYDRSGKPSIVSGYEYFTVFAANSELYFPLDPPITDAPTAPVWSSPKPKFEEFMDFVDGELILTAETEVAAGATIAAYAGPPIVGPFKLSRSRERYCGLAVFGAGLSAGESTTEFHAPVFDTWGQTWFTELAGQWLRLVEVDRGYARPLKDPCRPPQRLIESTVRNTSTVDTALGLRWEVINPKGPTIPPQFAAFLLAGSSISKQFMIPYNWATQSWHLDISWSWPDAGGESVSYPRPISPIDTEINHD